MILLPTSKTMNFSDQRNEFTCFTTPHFEKNAHRISARLARLSKKELIDIMHTSELLTDRVHDMYQTFGTNDSKCALFSYTGAVYKMLDAESLSKEDINYAMQQIAIISGLYGYLKASDLIYEYRLEMAAKIAIDDCKNLYGYWKANLTQHINEFCASRPNEIIFNLLSSEYSKAIDWKKINNPNISVNFKEQKGEKFRSVSAFGKQAKGLFTRFAIQHKITSIEEAKAFNDERYRYNPTLSTSKEMIFTR